MEDENNGLLTPGWTPREARLVTCCLCNFSSLSQKGVTIHLRKAHNIHLNPPRSKSQKAQRYRRPQSQHLHPPINGSFGRCAPGEVDMRFPPSTQYSLMGQMTSFNQNRHSLLPTQIDIQSLHDKYRDNNKLASFEQQNVTSSLQENTDPSTASLGFLHVNLTPSQSQNTPFSQCNEPHQNNAAFSQDGVPIMYETPDLNQSCDSSFHPTNCPVHDTTASQTNMVQSQYPVMPPLTRLPGLSLQDSSHSSLFENSVGGPWSWYLTQLCVICGYRARNDFDINRHMEADHANVNVYVQPETNNWPSIQESHNCVTETRLRIRPLNSDRVHSPCDRNSIKLEPLDVNLRDSDYLVHRSAEKQDVQRPHFPPSQLQSSSENRWKPARHSGDFTAMGNAEISSITPEFAHSHRTVNMLVDNVRGQRPQIGNLTVDCFAETDSRTTYSSGRLDINQLYNTHLEEKEVTSQQLARLREPPAQSAVAYKANVAPTIQAICEADHRQQHQVFSSNEIRAEINSNIGNSTEFLNCTRPCLGSVQRDPKMIGASAPSLTEAGLTAKSLLSSSGSSHTEVLCVTNKDALTGGDQTTKGGVHCIHFDDEAKRQVEHVNRIVIIDREMLAGAKRLESATQEICASFGLKIDQANDGVLELKLPPTEIVRSIGRVSERLALDRNIVSVLDSGDQEKNEQLEYLSPNGQKLSLRAVRVTNVVNKEITMRLSPPVQQQGQRYNYGKVNLKMTDTQEISREENSSNKPERCREQHNFSQKQFAGSNVSVFPIKVSEDGDDCAPFVIEEVKNALNVQNLNSLDGEGRPQDSPYPSLEEETTRITLRCPHTGVSDEVSHSSYTSADHMDFSCDDELFVRLPRLFPDLFDEGSHLDIAVDACSGDRSSETLDQNTS